MATFNHEAKKEESKEIKIYEAPKVLRVFERAYKGKTLVTFNMAINGIVINGCRVIQLEKGAFVGFPQNNYKDKEGNWHNLNLVYAKLSEEVQQDILNQVQELLEK